MVLQVWKETLDECVFLESDANNRVKSRQLKISLKKWERPREIPALEELCVF